jgi:hypothetical protein
MAHGAPARAPACSPAPPALLLSLLPQCFSFSASCLFMRQCEFECEVRAPPRLLAPANRWMIDVGWLALGGCVLGGWGWVRVCCCVWRCVSVAYVVSCACMYAYADG